MKRGSLTTWIATAGGAGYSPIAPGTCGTLVAVPVAWACRSMSIGMYVSLVVIVTVAAIVAAGRADAEWGTHDSQRIVIDEVAGYLVTAIAIDRGSCAMLAVAFVVFRLLDIVKPPPIRWFEKNLPGGFGVVLDDVVAGAMGAAVLAIVTNPTGIDPWL